jgi:hypothetical protein
MLLISKLFILYQLHPLYVWKSREIYYKMKAKGTGRFKDMGRQRDIA